VTQEPDLDETISTEDGTVVPAMTEPAEEAEAAGYDPGLDDAEPATEPDEPGEEDGEPSAEESEAEEADAPDSRGLLSVSSRQKLLQGLGFPVPASGVSGAATIQAVRWFQEAWTFSNLAVDGVWGPATEAAARQCVGQGGRISEHFHLPEFACHHCHWPRANRALVRGLERLRGIYYPGGLPIVSGYRCPVHNAAIGGARGSQHLYGRAANIPPRVTVEKVKALRLFAGLEYQPKVSGRLCTHVDVRAGGSVTNPSVFAWG
jgi:zinc D-Ala-D-Ala carboxypeptidase